MRFINLFYILVIVVGVVLWQLNSHYGQSVLSFYGFAENKETEVNFNYSVAIGRIYVQPGQEVKAGQKLLDMYRIQSKERLSEEPFLMAELSAKEQIWRTQRKGELDILQLKQEREVEEINTQIRELEKERSFQRQLFDQLITMDSVQHTPIEDKIESLRKEQALMIKNYEAISENIKEELRLGKNPYRLERERLEAELEFDIANSKVEIPLLATHDGVIGNIYCKEGEHVESFNTLLSIYEPNPTLVKGYVQEDLILQVQLHDRFQIRSTKDRHIIVQGEVTGLGSRIVEIPERLRKIPDLKTYGREILVRIPMNNDFLQKEKVILEFIDASEL